MIEAFLWSYYGEKLEYTEKTHLSDLVSTGGHWTWLPLSQPQFMLPSASMDNGFDGWSHTHKIYYLIYFVLSQTQN